MCGVNPSGSPTWALARSRPARERRCAVSTSGSGSARCGRDGRTLGPAASRRRLEDLLQLRLVVAQRLLGLLDRDVAAADQLLGVDLADRALAVDEVWYISGLRHRRVVALVVAAPAVADQVDDDVLVERLAVLEREPRRPGRTASGSSPFTWKIGAWIIRATSVQ